jgi:hypothetical protein
VTLVLLSATADAALHRDVTAIAQFRGRESMRVLNEQDLRGLLDRTRATYPVVHPLESLLTADSVEEAIYGGTDAQETVVRTDGRGVAISPESIRRQAITAAETGQLGEEAFDTWLVNEGHGEADYEWVSKTHGRAAFDFQVIRPRWEESPEPLYIDVKATKGAHDSAFHMSAAELRWAAGHPGYRIARLAALTATSAQVRILGAISEPAARILDSLRTALPAGVKVDSVEIVPTLFREVHSSRVEWEAEE